MGIREIFEKQGGFNLIKQYWRGGAFFTAVGEFALLGKSRTALEILRLSAQLKGKQKLERKYKRKLVEFDKAYDEKQEHKASNKVWVCWFQGIENAPQLVQRCYRSLKENLTDREIILITADNMYEYVEIPDYIIKKWENGQITHTHMTDLMRLELLLKYGGMWLDATVLCTRNSDNIPRYYFDSDLFLYQSLKPGRDGNAQYISSWLISAKTNNKILSAVKYLCYEYWKNNNSMMDYFLLHDFFSIVLEYYPELWKQIVPCDNSTPHILLLRLFDEYDEKMWHAIEMQTPFHKLTYKLQERKSEINKTYYDILIRSVHGQSSNFDVSI